MRARVEAGRLQRDALERLQEELSQARRQREALPEENAALAAEVMHLEQEVRALRREVADARAEARRAAASLPEQLVPPFHVLPSRRTLYGRLALALRALPRWLLLLVWFSGSDRVQRSALFGASLLFSLSLSLLVQGPWDDATPTWSFGEEDFFATEQRWMTDSRMRYADIASVEVRQGWLQRRFGLGSVRITARQALPGEKRRPPARPLTLEMLDEPQRLADWLRARATEAGGAR